MCRTTVPCLSGLPRHRRGKWCRLPRGASWPAQPETSPRLEASRGRLLGACRSRVRVMDVRSLRAAGMVNRRPADPARRRVGPAQGLVRPTRCHRGPPAGRILSQTFRRLLHQLTSGRQGHSPWRAAAGTTPRLGPTQAAGRSRHRVGRLPRKAKGRTAPPAGPFLHLPPRGRTAMGGLRHLGQGLTDVDHPCRQAHLFLRKAISAGDSGPSVQFCA